MWGRKERDDASDERIPETPPIGQPGRPTQAGAVPAPPVPPTNPAPGPATDSATISRIGRSVTFHGEIHADEDVHIDGKVEGKITIPDHQLVIGPHSAVQAEVHARALVLHGQLRGKVTVTERLEIKKQGRLTGDLTTHRLVIEDGAVFKGTSDMRDAAADKTVKTKSANPAPSPTARAADKPGRGVSPTRVPAPAEPNRTTPAKR